MKRKALYLPVLGALSIILLLPLRARAQSPSDYVYAIGNPTFGVNYPISGGYIDVANGNVHITIPLGTFKQRGNLPPVTLNLEYDSRLWRILGDPVDGYSWQPNFGWVAGIGGGWHLANGVQDPEEGTSYTESLSQTGSYTCNGSSESGSYVKYTDFIWTDLQGTMHTFDATEIQPASGPPCAATGTGYAIDGSGYYLRLGSDYAAEMQVYDSSGIEVLGHIQDANGNTVTVDSNGNVIDSMNRKIMTYPTGSGSTVTFQVLKEGGGYETYTIQTETVNVNTFFQQQAVTEYENSFTAIQSITLPDGSSYSFTYDSGTSAGHYGELTSMTLPTGGVVNLQYTNYLNSYNNENRWISEETENGANTTFSPQVISQCQDNDTVGCQEQTTVTRPSGDSRVYTFTLNNGAWNTQTDYEDGSSTKLMTTKTVYNFNTYPCTDPSICSGSQYIQASTNTVVLDDTQQTALTQYEYSKPWTAKVDSIYYYDYGASGTPTRETDYTYGSTPGSSVNGLPLLSQVTEKYDVNGTLSNFSQVTYSYDPSGDGNLTSVTRGFSGDTQATTSYGYAGNNYGQKTSMTDPNGNTTSYAYSPTCNYGYISQITYPATSGVSHIVSINPDCNSGLPLSTTDQNGQVTNYHYADPVGRITEIDYPDGGQTTYAYPSPTETTETRKISASVTSTITTTLDAYGRKSTVSLSDPAGDDTASYAYDSDGRLDYVYNPKRSGSSPTDGSTFTDYDALDRPSFIQPPSGQRITFAYSGNSETVTDGNGNQKRYQYDAFHDLTAVWEPNASGTPSWETDYTYDAAGHLLSVDQKGDGSGSARTRAFTYDDLGRLQCESTPEAGYKYFSYDPNGNMTASSTGAQSCTSGGQTIAYTYDALNRVLTKVGTDVNDTYVYDTVSGISALQGVTVTNAIGHMTVESNNVNAGGVFSYDAMGRLNWQGTFTPSSISSIAIVTQATYDLAGDLSSLTYPDGRKITETYDSAQHLTNIQYASWNGQSVGSLYYSGNGFAPLGEVTDALYGNGVQRNAAYNPNQSVTALSYQTASQVLWSKQYTWAQNGQNLLQMKDMVNPVQTVTYGYDTDNRLTSAQQPPSSPATAGSGTVTVSGSEQSGTIGTYNAGSASTTAQMTGQGTDVETGDSSPPFPSVALSASDAVSVTASIDYSGYTDGGTNIGKIGVVFQYSTNGGSTWTSFYTQNPVNNELSYGPQNVSFGPISGMTNLNQLQLRVQATAIGLGADSGVYITADLNSPTATVAGYDTGTVTITVNGHSDSAPFQAGSTVTSVGEALASAINGDSSAPVTATGGSQVVLTAKQTGSNTNYPVSVSWTNNSAKFPTPSFTLSGPSALSGGTDGVSDPNALDETYTYDAWGNMQRQGNYNFLQPFSSNNQISASGYSYDAAGDLLTDGIGDTYAYNAAGRMTASNEAQYVYDALGQMVAKIGGTNPGEIVYFGGRAITFRDPSSGGYTDLIWAGGALMAWVPGTQTSTPVYRLVDNQGTLAMTTDNSGNVTGTNQMTPYGGVLSSSAADPFPFAGLMTDTNGTNIAQYRNYATAPARWLRPDPYNGSYDLANPQSFNRYMYVNGNPLAFTDTSGLYPGEDTACTSESGNLPLGFSIPFCVPYFPGALGPVGAVLSLGLFAANFLNDIFGWWGQGVQFNGNVAASQSGKNVPTPSTPSVGSAATCKQASLSVRLVAAGMSALSMLTGKGFSFGYSGSGTFAAGIGGEAGGGQAIVTTTNGAAGIVTFGGGGVTGGFGASASMNLDFGISSYGTLGGYSGSGFGGSFGLYDGLGGSLSGTVSQSGAQGVISVGVGGGGAVKAGGSEGVSYGKAVPIC